MTVVEEEVQRKRRRRGRRGGQGRARPARVETQTASDQAPRRPIGMIAGWQWLTFPVLAAFVFGAFLILLIAPKPNTGGYTFLFFLFLGLAAFCLAHFGTRVFITGRRRKRDG